MGKTRKRKRPKKGEKVIKLNIFFCQKTFDLIMRLILISIFFDLGCDRRSKVNRFCQDTVKLKLAKIYKSDKKWRATYHFKNVFRNLRAFEFFSILSGQKIFLIFVIYWFSISLLIQKVEKKTPRSKKNSNALQFLNSLALKWYETRRFRKIINKFILTIFWDPKNEFFKEFFEKISLSKFSKNYGLQDNTLFIWKEINP